MGKADAGATATAKATAKAKAKVKAKAKAKAATGILRCAQNDKGGGVVVTGLKAGLADGGVWAVPQSGMK